MTIHIYKWPTNILCKMEGGEVSTKTLEVFLELSYTFLLGFMDRDGGARVAFPYWKNKNDPLRLVGS